MIAEEQKRNDRYDDVYHSTDEHMQNDREERSSEQKLWFELPRDDWINEAQFLEHLYKIAETTLDNESRTQSYAWFKRAEDNDVASTSWVRGFEAYDDIAASTEVHRSSNEYKAMRQAAGLEGFFERPSDLRYLRPIGCNRVETANGKQVLFQESRIDRVGEQYLVVDEITPKEGNKAEIFVALAELKSVLANKGDLVELILALEYLPEYEDDTVASVVLYDSRKAYKSCLNQVQEIL